ncbi:hypothetical protein [Streptomyces sp. NPDC005438]|uniref:hypothetical protein n=1 Tax=Streptomyces sp. NPDC005438 TaxID=3156880 RepID=UPI0033ABD594
MSKRQVSRMLREMASQDTVQVTSKTTVTKLARLALIAEQFGFMYGDAEQVGSGQNVRTVMTLHRDLSPEAQRRAAENFARFPQAGNGGDLPGMQPGGRLRPLPDAADHLELLKARVNFDLTGDRGEKRMLWGVGSVIFGFAFTAVLHWSEPDFVLVVLWVTLGCLFLLGIGFVWNRRRNARFQRVLVGAGLTPVRDGQGRLRYLPPGGQLPGHHNPFAPQGFGFPPVPAPSAPGHPSPTPQPAQPPMPPQAQPPGQYGQPPHAPGPYGAPAQPYGQPPAYQPQQGPASAPNPGQGGHPTHAPGPYGASPQPYGTPPTPHGKAPGHQPHGQG